MRPLSIPGRTRGALGLRSHVAEAGLRPVKGRAPSSSTCAGVWVGLSGPGPCGWRLCQACPSAWRGRLSMRRRVPPYLMIYCVIEIGVLVQLALDAVSPHRCFRLHICLCWLLLGVLVPNIRLVYSKCQFFGVLFAF